jgi:flagellar basal body rod protein FlgB
MTVNPVGLFDGTFDNLEKAMAVATRRQAVLADNIANAKTPGYRAKDFDEVLMKAVERQDRPEVNLEQEMAMLTENSVKYSAYLKSMTAKLSVLRSVVTQGRK